LQVWDKWGLSGYMDDDRKLLYRLLAGEVDGVVAALPSPLLDWRRVLGLYLWFRVSAAAPLKDVLRVFESSHHRDVAPAPAPFYHEVEEGPQRRCGLR
jgi:hypothetical protein